MEKETDTQESNGEQISGLATKMSDDLVGRQTEVEGRDDFASDDDEGDNQDQESSDEEVEEDIVERNG